MVDTNRLKLEARLIYLVADTKSADAISTLLLDAANEIEENRAFIADMNKKLGHILSILRDKGVDHA